jgi:hypothetical protein
MSSPVSHFDSNQKSTTKISKLSAKVYLRNFGKGLFEASNGSLRFYTEKGRFSKKVELSKEISLIDVDNLSLEGKELVVSLNDTIFRFVFEDLVLAQKMYTETNEAIQQRKAQANQNLPDGRETTFEKLNEAAKLKIESDQKGENILETIPEQFRQESSNQTPLEEPLKEVAPMPDETSESLPINLIDQKFQPNCDTSAPKSKVGPEVVYADIQTESEVLVEESPTEIEIAQNPCITSEIDKTIISQTGDEKSLIVEQPKAELNLEPPTTCKAPEKESDNFEKIDLDQSLTFALELVDSLFDTLRNLHGNRINWTTIDSYEKRSEKNYRAFSRRKIFDANLDFGLFSLAVAQRNFEAVSKEVFRILESFKNGFEKLPCHDSHDSLEFPNFSDAKIVILSYYVLSDLILAAVVEDENIEQETNTLVSLLNSLSNNVRKDMIANDIISAVNKIEKGQVNEADVIEVRQAFRNSLKISAFTG